MFDPIGLDEFRRRTGISGDVELAHPITGYATQVVSLRDLEQISAVQLMPQSYLEQLLRAVVLQGDNQQRVYANCKFHVMETSPQAAKLGQRFVESGKCLAFLEQFRHVLKDFCVPGGLSHSGAFIALGTTKDGGKAIALYLPPIMEMNGGSKWALLDGMHRNFLIVSTGGVMSIIAIEGVQEPFPCALHSWDDVKMVSAKPPIEERFFDLRTEFFRDLKYVGIDG